MTACRSPVWEPRRDNPGGDCLGPAIAAVPLGGTGRTMPVCEEHADRYERLVPLKEEL